MTEDRRRRCLIAAIAVAAAMLALVLLPFAGFTEKTDYWRSYEITGLGTWHEGLIFFEYPATLLYVSILLLAAVAVLIRPLRMLWTAYRADSEPTPEALAAASKAAGWVAAGLAALLLITMFVLLPSVEDETIWLVESGGFLTDWWPGYGAFVAIAGAGVALYVTRGMAEPKAEPAPPPPPPPPPA